MTTPAVLGNYIDIYDITRAVEDGATVPIYYEVALHALSLPMRRRNRRSTPRSRG